MIKAVFFDLYQTIIRYDPPREETLAQIMDEFGIKVTADSLQHPFAVADEFIHVEHSRLGINHRSEDEKKSLYTKYQTILLKEAGIEPTTELVRNNIIKMQQVTLRRILFDDVLSVLGSLKEKGYILGLISNIDSDIKPLLDELGLMAFLDVVVTSRDSGYHKPSPEIFRYAAEQAAVKVEESIYIGDQYQVDVLGAKDAGMQAVLLDRNGFSADDIKEPVVKNLYQLVEQLT